MTCAHRNMLTWFKEEDGEPAGLWSCADCRLKFVPITELEKVEAERDAALADNASCRDAVSKLMDECAALDGLRLFHEVTMQCVDQHIITNTGDKDGVGAIIAADALLNPP